MARFNLNFDQLTPRCQDAARAAGLDGACHNPFQSIVVRGIEILYACEEALRVIETYERPDHPALEVDPSGKTRCGFTEAPRGSLYHRYQVDAQGEITAAKIVPPTSQNQKTIERDLHRFVPRHLDLPDEKLQWQCEQAIRNYDPCISCSTHFLKLTREDVSSSS